MVLTPSHSLSQQLSFSNSAFLAGFAPLMTFNYTGRDVCNTAGSLNSDQDNRNPSSSSTDNGQYCDVYPAPVYILLSIAITRDEKCWTFHQESAWHAQLH